jgi:crotonobetainyl-CoA:carnitine CoA-transferase CaiB-like acyl-CoA transferase
MFTEYFHPRAGVVRTLAPNIRFSTVTSQSVRPAPILGEHGSEILESLGITTAEIASLKQEKVMV